MIFLISTITTLLWLCKKPTLIRVIIGLVLMISDLVIVGHALN